MVEERNLEATTVTRIMHGEREWSHEGLTGEPMVSGNGGSESQKITINNNNKKFPQREKRKEKKKKEWVESEYQKKKE